MENMKCKPLFVIEKERKEGAGFDRSLRAAFGVQRLEQSVSMFDMQVAKANAIPGGVYIPPLSSVEEVKI